VNRQEQKRLARSGKPLIKLHVLGAALGVTGSLNLIEYMERGVTTRFLLDAGLTVENESADFQNRLPSGMRPSDINFIILSHAHLDHSGFLPKLVKDGFKGVAYATQATRDLLEIMLPDSGYLQEEAARRSKLRAERTAKAAATARLSLEAGKADAAATTSGGEKKKKASRRGNTVRPALYTRKDAIASLDCLKILDYNRRYQLAPGIAVTLTDAGHILGSAVVNLEIANGADKKRFCFTGNVGRPDVPILQPAHPLMAADYLMTEATYGNKEHKRRDRLEVLAGIICGAHERARAKNGVILIPAFAVGRAQAVLNDLRLLMQDKRIPNIPVFVDGPMANRATEVHRKHAKLFNDKTAKDARAGKDPFTTLRHKEVMQREESEALDKPQSEPIIIVGSSGMAQGGRIVRHLMARLAQEENSVLFVGYQGTGTLGQALVGCRINPDNACATEVRIFGKPVAVKATVEFMGDYSGHADCADLLRLFGTAPRQPKLTFVVHGEPVALDALKSRIEKQLGWAAVVPRPKEVFVL
jgi:metallo-beta-lactamase family protein